MARKPGVKRTRETSARFRSNADVFAARGDPWVSDREGREQFGRRLDHEDPDFDAFFANKADERVERRSEPRSALANTPVVRLYYSMISSRRKSKSSLADLRRLTDEGEE